VKLVIQNTSRVWGGNEKWLATVARGLVARGHEAVVSCAKGPVSERLRESGIRTTHHRPRGAIDPASAASFAWFLMRETPDALLLTSWQPLVWGLLAGRAAKVPRMALRQGIVRSFPQSGVRARVMRDIDYIVIANSTEIREAWLVSAPWFRPSAVKIVLNAVEPRLERRVDIRGKLRREIGLSGEDELLIGGAGHLAPRKGFDYLLRAFASSAIPRSRVVIIGDGSHREELKRLAVNLGIDERVTFLGHRDDGPELLAGLDLFVLSSHNEGMANVMLEAMAGGTPVIASDVSGVRRAIGTEDGRPPAGWIVPPANDDALSGALRRASAAIRGGSSQVSDYVSEASWRVQNWFSLRRMIDECEGILFGKP